MPMIRPRPGQRDLRRALHNTNLKMNEHISPLDVIIRGMHKQQLLKQLVNK